jgi:hypothetical protein
MTDILDIAVSHTAIYRFGSPFDRSVGSLPGFFASKSFSGEDASQRVKWRSLVFHGVGTIQVNVYIDGVLALPKQSVTMTEIPSQERVINLPRGKSSGYMIRYEYEITSGYIRFAEIFYDPMTADVN